MVGTFLFNVPHLEPAGIDTLETTISDVALIGIVLGLMAIATVGFILSQKAAKYMMKKGHGGKIINIASVVGLMGNVGQVNYTAAKAGIIGLTKTVAREWARFGVTCNALAYGFVHTRFTADKETGEEVAGEKMGIPRKARERMLEEIGGRAMTPEDAAKPALFLASADSDFITGHVLNVSAGMYM